MEGSETGGVGIMEAGYALLRDIEMKPNRFESSVRYGVFKGGLLEWL
jgi:hypothetical protein